MGGPGRIRHGAKMGVGQMGLDDKVVRLVPLEQCLRERDLVVAAEVRAVGTLKARHLRFVGRVKHRRRAPRGELVPILGARIRLSFEQACRAARRCSPAVERVARSCRRRFANVR